MRALLDTNVLFAAFVTHGVCAGLYEECLLQADIISSNHILTELAEKLVSKGKFTKRQAHQVVRAVRKDAELVLPAPLAEPICLDPDDDWILATAIAGEADVIVTGDKELLVLKRFKGIPIVARAASSSCCSRNDEVKERTMARVKLRSRAVVV